MGSICDANDLERFMRSKTGQEMIADQIALLKGRTIVGVRFSNGVTDIAIILDLDDGTTFIVNWANVEDLREVYEEVIDEEYYKDYPQRRPNSD